MKALTRVQLALVLSAALAACGGGPGSGDTGSDSSGSGEAPAADQAPVAVPEGTVEVRCGCKIDTINHCGNYAKVDGDWVEISNWKELGLGHMEWCAAPADLELNATAAGTRTGDTVELTKLVVH